MQIGKQIEHLRPYGNVQSAYRLIRNYQLRMHNKHARNAYALPLSAGKLVREARCKFGRKPNVQHGLLDLQLPFLLRREAAYVIQPFRNDVVYLCALVERGHGVLKYHLYLFDDFPVRFLVYFAAYALSLKEYFTRRNGIYADYCAAYGGFAGAGLAHQTECFALIYVETYALYGLELFAAFAEFNMKVFDLKQFFPRFIHWGWPPSICPSAAGLSTGVLFWASGDRAAMFLRNAWGILQNTAGG